MPITVQLNNLTIAHEQLVARFWKEFDDVLKKLEAPKRHLKARWWNYHIPRVPPPDTGPTELGDLK
jgi:hypothetical protein